MRQGANTGAESSRLFPLVSIVKTAIKHERERHRANVDGGDMASLHMLTSDHLLQVHPKK